jgi:phosphate transport system substrate-binding protein
MRLLICLFLVLSFNALAREQIRIVGSSTLYPFITIAAEKFGSTYGYTPVVEAIGTGGGIKLFCSGDSLDYPDIVNASRIMKKSEKALCKKNNVTNIKEIMIGYDGIILAGAKNSKIINLTKYQLFLALAKKNPQEMRDNPYYSWKDIDPNLPDSKIEIYGPSFTSGTRDALIELVMDEFCKSNLCKEIRDDGHYIEMPENDNLIIHKLTNNNKALGIISFSLLNENIKIKAIKINNVIPSKSNIISRNYPLSRPLFIYVNQNHMKIMPDIELFINELTSPDSIGVNGYLTHKGLLTLYQFP